MPMKTYKIVAYVNAEDVDAAEVMEYVSDAIGTWGGQFHPDDPMFTGNKQTEVVSVRQLERLRKIEDPLYDKDD